MFGPGVTKRMFLSKSFAGIYSSSPYLLQLASSTGQSVHVFEPTISMPHFRPGRRISVK